MISQTYDLNLIPGGIPIRVPVSQYDSGASRSLIFNLYYGEEGNGQTFTIPTGSTITIEGTKPDKKSFSYAATYSGSSVTVPLHEQMAVVEGDVVCQLTITKDTQIIGTANFIIYVEPAPLKEGSDMSESEISEFRELAAQAQASASAAATSASQAVTRLSELGTLSNLTTDAKSNLVAAINEVDAHTDDAMSRYTPVSGVSTKTLTKSGLYYCYNGCTDTPDDTLTWVIEVFANTSGTVVKQVIRRAAADGIEYERHYTSSTWSDLSRNYFLANDVIIVTASFGTIHPNGDTSITIDPFNQQCKRRIEGNSSRKCYLATKTGGGFKNNGFRDALMGIESEVTDPGKVGIIMICGGGNDARDTISSQDISDGMDRFMTYAKAQYPNAVFRFAWLSWKLKYTSTLPQRWFNTAITYFQDLCPRHNIGYCANSEWIYHQHYDSWYISDQYHPSTIASNYIADRIMDCIMTGSTHVNREENIAKNTFLHRTTDYESSNPIQDQCGFNIRMIDGTTTITPNNEIGTPAFKLNFESGFFRSNPNVAAAARFTFSSGLFMGFLPSGDIPQFPVTIVAIGTNHREVFPAAGKLKAGSGYISAVMPYGFDSSAYTTLHFYLPTITIPSSYA